MLYTVSPIEELRRNLANGTTTPRAVAQSVIEHANTNPSRNTYHYFNPAALLAQAEALPRRFPDPATRPPLYGIPVSLKDCFDLAGTVTTCGARFYAERNPPAAANSAVAQRLLDAGCLVTGKTHLHALAYGITGQNRDYGDCLQPRDPTLLTGGSSSGAAGGVQEGSALAAIGTDTGGSVRVPAALCGLAGYRASHNLTDLWPDLWRGAHHLAPSFDTLGLLFRDPQDAPLLANALFGIPLARVPTSLTIGCVPDSFLHDAEPAVLAAYQERKLSLQRWEITVEEFDPAFWHDSLDLFAPLQAHEAANLHRGHFHHFEAPIAQRLAWGESTPATEIAQLQLRLADFREQMAALFTRFDLLMLPCAPVSRLLVDADQTAARQAILRYTTPFSLGGLPTITVPDYPHIGGRLLGVGSGIQIAAAPGQDAMLLAFAAALGDANRLSLSGRQPDWMLP